jgi:hypothetical protein
VIYYCSFADDVFRGAVMVRAKSVPDALKRINKLGLNPGGEMAAAPMPDDFPQDLSGHLDILFNRQELEKLFEPSGGVVRSGNAGYPEGTEVVCAECNEN